MGGEQGEGDPQPLHHHQPGLEARRLAGRLRQPVRLRRALRLGHQVGIWLRGGLVYWEMKSQAGSSVFIRAIESKNIYSRRMCAGVEFLLRRMENA